MEGDTSITGNFEGGDWRGDIKMMLLDTTKLNIPDWRLRRNSEQTITLAILG